jgi:hypothetical protein
MDVTATRTDPYKPVTPPASPPTPKAGAFDKLDAATAGSTTALDPATIGAARDAAMTAKIDAYFNNAAAPYTVNTPSGEQVTVKVAPQFHMVGGCNDVSGAKLNAALGPALSAKLAHEIDRARAGRGTPEDVTKITAGLIARGHLPPVDAKSAPEAIQALQWKYGIGVDCAGYTQRAFLAIRGKGSSETERTAMGLKARATDENFASLPTNPKFKKVDVASARPGDIMTLRPPPSENVGHVVLVRSNTLVPTTDAKAMGLTGKGPHRALVVDSSWGAGELGKGGGVLRRTWIYDEGDKKWSSWDPASKKLTPSNNTGPYDHPLDGIYRPKGEP